MGVESKDRNNYYFLGLMRVIVFDLNFEVFDNTSAILVFDLKIFIPYPFNTL
jgi:hypothetical protein